MTKRITFIDSRVANCQTLIADLPADTEWFVLKADEDGLGQMANILKGYSDLVTIDVISHGSVGTLYLGSTVLNSENLSFYVTQLGSIRSALSETGDILLYGCNVAEGEVGYQFVTSIAQATGADMAASDDLTGTTALGGNWELEKYVGSIDLIPTVFTSFTGILVDDYAASTSTTGTLSIGGTKTGSIESAGDYDWFNVILTAGTNYSFEALGLDTSSGTLGDPYLELYNSAGGGLTYDDDSGTGYNASFTYTPTTSGTYYLAVSEGWDEYTGTYTVRATTFGQNTLGTLSNDTLTGGAGVPIDGLAGIDTVVYSGNRSSYEVIKTASGYTVSGGSDGTDTLTNIERLQFGDMTANLTIQSIAAAAPQADVQRLEELYVAFFNRVPDADGLAYWIGQMNAGQSLNQIAEAFYNAGVQFSSLTGFSATMSNADFVNVIYRNVLGRSEGADSGGLAYWSGALANHTETHGSLVSSILSSAHTYNGDATWGWVADLLDNKISVANQFAVAWGLNYNTPNESITQGMAIAAAVTPTSTAVAIALIGVSATDMQIA